MYPGQSQTCLRRTTRTLSSSLRFLVYLLSPCISPIYNDYSLYLKLIIINNDNFGKSLILIFSCCIAQGMASYQTIVKDVIKKPDILLEVIDARFPDETRNNEVELEITRSRKPFIIVINKCDLVSKETLERTKIRLSKIAPTVFISTKNKFGTTMLRHKILETAAIKGRDILVGSVGYPNTTKSSVINAVSGRHSAGTSSI